MERYRGQLAFSGTGGRVQTTICCATTRSQQSEKDAIRNITEQRCGEHVWENYKTESEQPGEQLRALGMQSS